MRVSHSDSLGAIIYQKWNQVVKPVCPFLWSTAKKVLQVSFIVFVSYNVSKGNIFSSNSPSPNSAITSWSSYPLVGPSCQFLGICEPHPSEEKIKSVIHPDIMRNILLPEGEIIYEPKLRPYVYNVIDTEPARELLNKVLADGPINILLGDDSDAPAGGKWIADGREITINKSEHPDRKLGHLLFEMANALQAKEQLQLQQDSSEGKVSREDYVKRWEEIEYNTAKIFSSTIQRCIKDYGWPVEAEMGISQLVKLNWEQLWNIIKNSDHANLFRSDWDALFSEKYCKINPGTCNPQKIY